MFKGSSSISLDAKGRLSMPTRHRDMLTAMSSGQMTITLHPDGCLLMFPRTEWDSFYQRVTSLPASAQWWKRVFLHNAIDVELDGAGRVLISPELRELTGISKEVWLAGSGNYFELWDKATYVGKTEEAKLPHMRPADATLDGLGL